MAVRQSVPITAAIVLTMLTGACSVNYHVTALAYPPQQASAGVTPSESTQELVLRRNQCDALAGLGERIASHQRTVRRSTAFAAGGAAALGSLVGGLTQALADPGTGRDVGTAVGLATALTGSLVALFNELLAPVERTRALDQAVGTMRSALVADETDAPPSDLDEQARIAFRISRLRRSCLDASGRQVIAVDNAVEVQDAEREVQSLLNSPHPVVIQP